jgi:peroxiredoxin
MLRIIVLASFLLTPSLSSGTIRRAVRIRNDSGHNLEFYDVRGEELKFIDRMVHGQTLIFNSFVGREMQVREVPSTDTGLCEEQTCHTGYIVVSKYLEQSKIVEFR